MQSGGNYQINFTNLQAGDSQKGRASGVVFSDPHGETHLDAGNVGLAGAIVFADLNRDGLLEPGEPFATTDARGAYTLSGLAAGQSSQLTVIPPTGSDLIVTPRGGYALASSQAAGSFDFAVRPHLLQPIADATGAPGQAVTVAAMLTPAARREQALWPGRLVFALATGARRHERQSRHGNPDLDAPRGSTSGHYTVTVRSLDTQDPLLSDARTFDVILAGATLDIVPAAPPTVTRLSASASTSSRPASPDLRRGHGPGAAQDPANYILLAPNGRRIAVISARYDPATPTVTLAPAR